ncbi:MAG: family 16 glycosylhydrolase [Clostridiales bacterium]|nr:family 16 glycosylhydrolase [Clostridiales bacterium]
MKSKKTIAALAATALAVSIFGGMLAACDGPQEPLDDEALSTVKVADYTTGKASDRADVFPSDGFENGDVFNTWWSADNVTFDNGVAALSISEMKEKEKDGEGNDCQAEYYGGEIRTSKYYGYGDYEVSMKISSVPGTASTFFVCTGPYDVNYETQIPNAHDEIDIEFLGKDPTIVQFNYFVNGKGGHEYIHKLGFDASKEFHTYGFRWTSEYIVWFVDGEPVYKVNGSSKNPMPSTPGRILTNYWTGTNRTNTWMGKFNKDYSGKAEYQYIDSSAAPLDDPTKAPPEPPEEVPVTGWTDIDASGFAAWDNKYTVSGALGTISMSHTEALSAYACSGMRLTDSYSWVKFRVKNNSGNSGAVVRVDIKKENPSTSGISSVISEYEGAEYDLASGAAVIKLAAGDEADVVCKINGAVTVDQLVLFLNSSNGADSTAGDITVSALKGITATPSTGGDNPGGGVEGEPCELTFTNTEEFTVDKSGEAASSVTVTYENIPGGTYKNIQAPAATLAAGNNTFSIKIKNNGGGAVTVRVDLIGERKVTVGGNNEMDVCNLSSTNVGGSGCYTDTEWGGTYITLAAGEDATVTITYSNTNPMGAVQRVQLYLDTATYGDTNTHSGNVTFSDFIFANKN